MHSSLEKRYRLSSTFSSEDYHFNMDCGRMGGQAPLTYEGYQELWSQAVRKNVCIWSSTFFSPEDYRFLDKREQLL